MVGYGKALRNARRDGWSAAYLDYDSLKSHLEEVERLYEAFDEQTAGREESSSSRRGGEVELLIPHNSKIHSNAAVLEAGLGGVDPSSGGGPYHSGSGAQPSNGLVRQALEVKIHEQSERFLRTLRKQVEKVSLFALSRQGELADAVGSMRFNPFLDGSDELSTMSRLSARSSPPSKKENLTVRHDSRGNIKTEYGSMHSSDSNLSNLEFNAEAYADSPIADDLWFLLPNISPRRGNDVNNSSLRLRETLDAAPRPLFTGSAVLKSTQKKNVPWQKSGHKDGLALDDNEERDTTENGDEEEGPTFDPYTLIGVELLHLLRFICVNAMAVRKILKKYDKLIQEHSPKSSSNDHLREDLNFITPFQSSADGLGPDAHLQQLTNSNSLAAITSSLLKASLIAGSINVSSMEKFLIHDEALLRFKCSIDCIDILREYANVVNEPFPAFLSRKAMIMTGYNLGGMEGAKQKALEVLLMFDPDTILLMDKPELAEWQQKCWEYTFTTAGNKMRRTTFDMGDGEGDVKLAWGGVDGPSMVINMMSTLLYTVNYYIVAPTANSYAVHLGTNGAFGSTLIGASSFAAMFAALFYSLWYNKLSFKSALIFSSLCPIVGNLMYSVALSMQSMKIALVGRILVGFGSAEVVNRQMISSCVHFNYMTKASAAFVVAGAAGMSVGPLLAAILDSYAGRDFEKDFEIPYFGGVIFDHVSSPGFLMAALWFIQLVAIIFSFSEPFRINNHKPAKKGEEASFISSFKTVFRLVFSTPALPITLFLFAFIEMVCEVLISSCAMVSKRYFHWTGAVAGFLIASLGALVLPAHFVVEHATRIFDERAIMKYSLGFITVALFGILNYQTMYYDVVAGSNYVEQTWDTVKNASVQTSVETWDTVKNVSVEYYHTLRDPSTWDTLLNETEQDWQRFENMSAQEWAIFQNFTVNEWDHLQEEGSEEWGHLRKESKEKYSTFANATQEEWVELRKESKTEWHHLINESESEWEKVSDAAVNEWTHLPNQTEEELHKLDSDVRNEWDNIGDQTHHLWNETEEKFGNAKNAAMQKAGELTNVASTKWNEFSTDATKKGEQMRDATVSKWGEWSSDISDALDGVANMSENLLHTAIDRAEEVSHSNDSHSERRLHQLLPYDWNYGYYAYLIGISAIFMGTIILEGVDTSLMCKSAPSKLNSTFINVGLLATMVGTFGRVMGDGIIMLSALLGLPREFLYTDFVNSLFIPLIPITLLGLYLVSHYYWSLKV